jgi:heme O synthase-like polyprenyltransferase
MSHPSVALKVSVMYLHIPSALVVGSLIHVASVYTLIFIINMLLIICNVGRFHVYPTIYTPLLHLSSFPSSSFSFILLLALPLLSLLVLCPHPSGNCN